MKDVKTIKVGDTFTIELEGNPTTGYTWEINLPSEYAQIINLIDIYWKKQNSLVGGPSIQYFVFEALSQGLLTLVFRYRRSWEKDNPLKERTFHIRIDLQ
jgi:inhibitor of cysteine peptidase